MVICKFDKTEDNEVLVITRDNFEKHTNKSKDYIFEVRGKNQYYAYCPSCGNPIVLVNLYVDQDHNEKKPTVYGKHSVPGNPFDLFNVETYKRCLLKSKNKIAFSKHEKHRNKDTAEFFKKFLYENIYEIRRFVSHILGINISQKQFDRFLDEFERSEGYYYKGLDIGNLPYLILFLSNQQNITYQFLNKDSSVELEASIKGSSYFDIKKTEEQKKNEGQIVHKEIISETLKNRVSIYTVFKHHTYDKNQNQHMVYEIYEKLKNPDEKAQETLIVSMKILLDTAYMYNLARKKEEEKKH